MADVNYTPVFHHTDWVDRVDRVVAGGSNGFNGRFNTIAGDLRTLSTVVTQIGQAIDESVAPAPPPPTQELIFTPVVRQVSPAVGWFTSANGLAQVQSQAGTVVGVTNLTLTDRVRLISMRANGFVTGNVPEATACRIELFRAPVRQSDSPATPDSLAVIAHSTAPITETAAVTSTFAQVDLNTFRYFIRFTLIALFGQGTMVIDNIRLAFANS
ncbi:hypothetical protein [Amycolatopsis sp. NPDC021455]|uniref:hypothetical protein n=1 Tax=Amycolatopsis sp. NPDC021455 TaxID=3154901 RepID=UPI0033E7E302